jgi:hypothetical protein
MDGELMKKILFLSLLFVTICHAQILSVILYSASRQAATPTFSPAAGTYYSTQTVTISAATGGVICYNTTGSPATNGTTGCTTGTLYTGTVSVSTTETLYAVAGGTGYTDSAVGSAAYTIVTGAFVCPASSGASYDTFAGTSGTALAAYNSCWVNLTSSYVTSHVALAGSNLIQTSVYQGGAAYNGSTSDTAQMIFEPATTSSNTYKAICVRSTPGTSTGYCWLGGVLWGGTAVSSGEATKNGVALAPIYGCTTMNTHTTAYTIALKASGTSTVTLTGYVNGVACTTNATDSSSTITSGIPGFWATYGSSLADTQMGKFCDYFC